MPTSSPWIAVEGASIPPGVTYLPDLKSFNFTLYSKFAEKVNLHLFSESDLVNPLLTYEFDYLKNKTGRIWHCIILASKMQNARYYGYSVDGPPAGGPFDFHCFDPRKLLLDPYAKTVFFPPTFERAAAIRPGSNFGRAPLAVIPQLSALPSADHCTSSVCRHSSDSIIYELHVRGFTQNPNSGVSEKARVKFAGVIEKIP